MPTVVTIRRLVLNSTTLTYLLGGLLFVYIGHDLISNIYPSNEGNEILERTKREIDTAVDANEDDPSLSRLARKILNESESYVEIEGKQKPIPIKDLNKNYKEAKEEYENPKAKCINKTDASQGGGGGGAPPPAAEGAPAEEEPAPPPPPEGERRKRNALPFCEDLEKEAKAGGGGGGGGAAPPPAGDDAPPPAAEDAPPPPPAEE